MKKVSIFNINFVFDSRCNKTGILEHPFFKKTNLPNFSKQLFSDYQMPWLDIHKRWLNYSTLIEYKG